MVFCFHNAALEEFSMKFALSRFGLEEVEIDQKEGRDESRPLVFHY